VPELPEVETVVRELRPRLVGRRIVGVSAGRKSLRRAWTRAWSRVLPGNSVRAVGRRGKWITIALDGGQLLFHLGMTGQLTIGQAGRPIEPHTHLYIDFDNGEQLRYRDVRRFGSVTYFSTPAEAAAFLAARLGPEPFELTSSGLHSALNATRRPLKAALLDQAVLAGVGNIYADESLYLARLSPRLLGCEMTVDQARRLRRAIVRVLQTAIDRRGSSIRDYVDGSGRRGTYQREFRVYGRQGEPCRRCRAPIVAIRLAGRTTHFCPKCQESDVVSRV
jgi:formamidopyrimidine-DNA glycosylase